MGRVSIKLDGFDLEKLIIGETLKFSVHISPVDQITTNPLTSTPEKRVTFPIREVHAIFEYHNKE